MENVHIILQQIYSENGVPYFVRIARDSKHFGLFFLDTLHTDRHLWLFCPLISISPRIMSELLNVYCEHKLQKHNTYAKHKLRKETWCSSTANWWSVCLLEKGVALVSLWPWPLTFWLQNLRPHTVRPNVLCRLMVAVKDRLVFILTEFFVSFCGSFVLVVTAGMKNIAQTKNRPMILIGGWVCLSAFMHHTYVSFF